MKLQNPKKYGIKNLSEGKIKVLGLESFGQIYGKDYTVCGGAVAIKLKAAAEAERIRLTKLAEAEGAKAMAEAKKVEIAANTANISALKEAGIDDMAIVQIMMKDEYKFIVEAEQKKFEHLQLGDVKVIGGNSEAGKFLTNVVDAVQKSSTVADQIPGLPGITNLLGRFDKNQLAKLLSGNDPKDPTPEPEEPKA